MKIRSYSVRVLRGRGEFVGFICALCFILLFSFFPGTALASNVGYLDPGFGTGGIAGTSFSATMYSYGSSMELQADGKFVVAGMVDGINGVARFMPDGSPDTGFGAGGWASSGLTHSFPYQGMESDLAVQPDGRIVLAAASNAGSGSMAVARFNSDGTLDTSFGTGGVTETDMGPYVHCETMILQPDGKILVGGQTGTPAERLLIRYLPDGTLDNTFGTAGIVLEPGVYGPRDMALQPDGRIVMVVSSDEVMRYNQDGSLDTSFGTGGITTITFPEGQAAAFSVTLLPDGRILVAGGLFGTVSSPPYNQNPMILARLNSDGSFDTGFGTDGKMAVPLHEDIYLLADRPELWVYDMILQPDGRIVVVGQTYTDHNPEYPSDIFVVRLLMDGSPDQSFHRTGWVIQDINNNKFGSGRGVALQSDGKIVVMATTDAPYPYIYDPDLIVLLRYLVEDTSTPVTAVSMGPDINNSSLIKVLDGSFAETGSFTAFDGASVRYGARVALGDIDGDGADEVITAKGEGSVNNSEVKVFEVDGTPVSGANFVAFSSTYRGGANVAAGDLDGDGREEIIVGSSEGRPLVRIFTYDIFYQLVRDRYVIFNPFPGQACGVNVAAADIDGDGVDELITTPAAKSASPSVAVWSMDYDIYTGWAVNPYTGSFYVPLAADLLMNATGGGVALAATGGLFAAGTGAGGGEAELYTGAAVYDCRIPLGDTTTRQRTGIELAAGDADGDGLNEILLALGRNPGSSTGFSVYDGLCGWETDIGPVFPGAAYGARLAVGSTF